MYVCIEKTNTIKTCAVFVSIFIHVYVYENKLSALSYKLHYIHVLN